MKNNALIALALSIGLGLSSLPGPAFAGEPGGWKKTPPETHEGKADRVRPPRHRGQAPNGSMTPYGDYCRSCSNYGFCDKELKPREAIKAIKAHFEERGLTVVIVEGRGRFIRADITKDGKIVDCVVFDKKTGRLRPID